MSSEFTQECEKARILIYENVKKELLGPGSEDIGGDIEHELITDPPITRYSTGILFPQKTVMGQDVDSTVDFENNSNNYKEEQEELNVVKEEIEAKYKSEYIRANIESQNFEAKISMSNEMKPSSMGLTFFAKGDIKELSIRIKGAKYRKSTLKDCCVLYEGEDYFEENQLKEYVYREDNCLKLKQNLTYKIIKEYKDNERFKDDFEYKSFITVLYALARQVKGEKYESEGHVREPLSIPEIVKIKLNGNYTTYDELPKEFIASNKEKIELNLQISIYTKEYNNDVRSYTVVLVNNEECNGYGRDLKSIFQPEIRILSEDNKGMIFVENRDSSIVDFNNDLDEEEQSLELLYSRKKNYAIGHGISVMENVNDSTGLGELITTYLPTYIVKGISFDIEELSKEESEKILSMKNLSDYSQLSKDEVILNLNIIVNLYDNWIRGLKREIDGFKEKNERFRKAATRQIQQCEICSSRIKKGIKILSENNQAHLAFQLMNRALMMQRVQANKSRKERYPDDEDIPYPVVNFKKVLANEAKWRPFQIAYILMCLESIVNPNSSDRDLVDLIWVPTGGGKTEAYLGLTAFTIFLRRLKDKNNGGTTVIMRYTLRLLAAQQFTRASILICACEIMRREMQDKLGKERITIGLWIGSKQTPNNKEEAHKAFDNLTEATSSTYVLNTNKDKYNMFQVLKCPWCGTKLEKDIIKDKKTNRYSVKGEWGYQFTGKVNKIYCPEEECEFREGKGLNLPIQVVDDLIYEEPPTLLFGTVDKFAMTTWNENAGNLFGIGSKSNKSPELIIQDELHLISGPLGTIVGEYETAIDILCSENEEGTRPKIIASTATIRKAKEQCNQLYARDVKQFPPSGLYEDDSFFIKEDNESVGRQYVGIMPTGKTLTTTQVRLMSVLSNKVKMMDLNQEVKSKYWTLVGYFNTIKELGMTRSLISADIQDNIEIVSTRLLKKFESRRLYNIAELTSRVSANTINNTLKDLETEYSERNIENKKYAIDILLASNMISVGVDVSRLNLMMVLQQPKLTSEYIQATSRVGRENPGIVFTLYNPSRSRDKSYYELFHDYHQSFYKYVEPTSVTSFSEQARERMLHSIFVALIRHAVGLSSEEQASAFANLDEDIVEKYKEKIIERVEKILTRASISEEVINKEIKEVRDELNLFCEDWKKKIDESDSKIKYSNYRANKKDDVYRYLIKPFGKAKNIEGKSTLQAMRNVDQQGSVEILTFGDEKNE